MATSTVLPPLTATYPSTYPSSCITANVPKISNGQVRASIFVKLSPIDTQLTAQFAPTVDIGGTYGNSPNTVVIPSTAIALYDGTEFSFVFYVAGNVPAAVIQANAWTTAVVANIASVINTMRATDAAITLPPGATLTVV